jgi:hypothetical protein
MDTHEGARRIKLIGKSLMVLAALDVLFFWGAGGGSLLLFTLLPFVFGAAMWIVGWVVDGFSQQPNVGRQI